MIVGILMLGRILNNRDLIWTKRKRSLSEKRELIGRERARANHESRSLNDKSRGKVGVRQPRVTGNVRGWKRESAPWIRVVAMVVLLSGWAYLVGRFLSVITSGMGRGLHIPAVMIVFVIAMALGFKVFSLFVFPKRVPRTRRSEVREDADPHESPGEDF